MVGGGGSTPSSTPTSPTSGGGTQTTVTITITGKNGKLAFSPNPATVAAGQLVVFKNNDVVMHHVMLDDGSMQTPDIAPGGTSAAVAMGTSGANTYHCTIHPGMVGGFNGADAEPPPNCNWPTASAVARPHRRILMLHGVPERWFHDGGHYMAARQQDGRSRVDGLRWVGIGVGVGVAAAALAVRQFSGARRPGGTQSVRSPEVGKAFTINRAADEVAQLWSELDPIGDVVEHVPLRSGARQSRHRDPRSLRAALVWAPQPRPCAGAAAPVQAAARDRRNSIVGRSGPVACGAAGGRFETSSPTRG